MVLEDRYLYFEFSDVFPKKKQRKGCRNTSKYVAAKSCFLSRFTQQGSPEAEPRSPGADLAVI
jgi:hypothetical protein